MALTRLDNLYSSKTGKYLYVSPDDFNATDALDNRGNSPLRPFKTIQRAFIEVARYSYLPGKNNDRFDQFSIMLMPGDHYIDNRPGLVNYTATTNPTLESDLPIFNFDQTNGEWDDNSILDLSNSNNVLYKFNASTGGAIVPRGCSLVGYDLRRTIIRPLFVPDPADGNEGRTSIFNLTGGCYLWQFTIKDGDLSENSPLFNTQKNVGEVYYKADDSSKKQIPEYSHHKICIMEYADNSDLDLFYEKVGTAFSKYQPSIDEGEFEPLVQENRIVGPLSDTRVIESIKPTNTGTGVTFTVTTKINHGYFEGQYVAILNTGLDEELNGTVKITSIDNLNPKVFTYEIVGKVAGAFGLVDNQVYTTSNGLDTNCVAQAEIDSVESASPYVFNCSIRSTWGQCGMWANGAKATGFKSMVVAQYTGVSLQKDDRAFIRYDRFTNTWNEASLTDAFATVPYHTKGDAYWKDDWRNFHIRASEDSFIQCVSVFAVGFFDHFLMESGGDMSITNSNSNFGNTSLHAIGHKGYSFNQDKGGYISHIVPPEEIVGGYVDDPNKDSINSEKIPYYTIDILATNDSTNKTKLYLSGDDLTNPANRPAASLGGYRIGARSDERLFVKLDPASSGGSDKFYSILEPSGFETYTVSMDILNPPEIISDSSFNKRQDSANRIEANKILIQNEVYQYITRKYPTLTQKTTINIEKCRRDIGYYVDAVVKDLRLGGNINTIQAAESYYVAGELTYIENELTETTEALRYTKDHCIAAMRNYDFLIENCTTVQNSAVVNVGDTSGLVIGMRVQEYASTSFEDGKPKDGSNPIVTNIQADTYIKRIIDSQTIELGSIGSFLNSGSVVNAKLSSSSAYLYFELLTGIFDEVSKDDTLVQDTTVPECNDIASTIDQYFVDIIQILSVGLDNNVEKIEPEINISSLASRATVFTLAGGNPTNFETGTPVRLVPKAKPGTIPDKRVIRLPDGFETNKKYYIIAPGRNTYPENYGFAGDQTKQSVFNGSDQTKFMLASSKENAAAGIYIYSPETDSIDPDVEIQLQKFVLDDDYDLHTYKCTATGIEVETDVAHIFDVPAVGVTPQLIFFRLGDDTSTLPQTASGEVDTNTFYYARYIDKNKFSVHESQSDAIFNIKALNFVTNTGKNFRVYANKRNSPLRFDPTYTDDTNNSGLWYLNVKDDSIDNTQNIISRLQSTIGDYADDSGKIRTNDTWFERVIDNRDKKDRVYRLRYVIPEYLTTVRDPLNGFVLKIRTDDTRRLLPQKITLVPKDDQSPDLAIFFNSNPENANEQLGLTSDEYEGLSIVPSYDPYLLPKTVNSSKTKSRIAFDIQSAFKNDDGNLEIVAFNYSINNQQIKNENLTVVKIKSPQGGSFNAKDFTFDSTTLVTWTGYSSGTGYVHAFLEYESEYYLILKQISGSIKYNKIQATTFEQGSTFADLDAAPDSVGSVDGKSKSDRNDYLYRVAGANAYTLVPGDEITDDADNVYLISQVEDVGEIEDTFYIFDIDEIQERIPGQQDGIYYLTCVKGNISPYPTGAGVGTNFRNFKFSQPISQLYPLNYKNDPLWYKELNTSFNDPPATICAADNYVHGLVRTNDAKNSETKEVIYDLVETAAFGGSSYTLDNKIEARLGNAVSGSEDRLIPIKGDNEYPSQSKVYVELRRPSIARSGNHTFEYLGFGPGNYSTGFPLRQEVILSDLQDFYAQSKKEDGGIVFYTGLNSNGDLYIGNRKINAITGEETFLEKADLLDSNDEDDDLGGALVTTFDTPVTFNNNITVNGESTFNNPILVNVPVDEGTPIRVYSKVDSENGDDITLDRSSYRPFDSGDITLGNNRVKSAIYELTGRSIPGLIGQSYTIRSHFTNSSPSNTTPNQTLELNVNDPTSSRFSATQFVVYGDSEDPKAGDILLKGSEVGRTGSLGWIFASGYTNESAAVDTVVTDGTNKVKINWKGSATNFALNISKSSKIRINGFPNPAINGTWDVDSATYDPAAEEVTIIIGSTISALSYTWQGGSKLEVGNSVWKEAGLLGVEAIRTDTDAIGEYKLGVNTVARSLHSDCLRGFTSDLVDPRANLDVVGNVFISGKKILSYLTEPSATKTETAQDNALIVGGDSDNPDDFSTFRVSTTDLVVADQGITYRTGGRVGINTKADSNTFGLDRNFVVIGDGRITGNFLIEKDISVDGGDVNSTSETFNLIQANVKNLNFANDAQVVKAFSGTTTSSQVIEFGTKSLGQDVYIGSSATQKTKLLIHNASSNAEVKIATVPDEVTSSCDIEIGGAFSAGGAGRVSELKIATKNVILDGELTIGNYYSEGSTGNPARLRSRVAEVDLFTSDLNTQVSIATSCPDLRLGGLGGSTVIRNALKVQSSLNVDSNIKLIGGLNAGIVEVQRGRFSTTVSTHSVGDLSNQNIDVFKYVSTGRFVNTSGEGVWGGESFKVAGGGVVIITGISGEDSNRNSGTYPNVAPVYSGAQGAGSGLLLNIVVDDNGGVTITDIVERGSGYAQSEVLRIPDSALGNGGAVDVEFTIADVTLPGVNYVLPISTSSVSDFSIDDLLLLDRGNINSPDTIGVVGQPGYTTGLRNQQYSELVRVVRIINLTDPNAAGGYALEVTRGLFGTTAWTNHPEDTVIAKIDRQPNASYLTGIDTNQDGNLDVPSAGMPNSNTDLRIGVAEFGGVLTTSDYLFIDGNEILSIQELISTDIQSLIITTGDANPEVRTFVVESTTGNISSLGSLALGAGYNKFTVNGSNGNTNIAGTLTTENSITLNGSTIVGTQKFIITDGTNTKFSVDSATGNLVINGGNIDIFQNNGTTQVLKFVNSSGDFTTYGSLSALGTGLSTFGGSIKADGGLELNFQDGAGKTTADAELSINNTNGTEIFKVSNNGSVKIAGVENFFSSSGGRRWQYVNTSVVSAQANFGYFVDTSANTLIKLPSNAQMGDTVHIIDIGGNLSNTVSMIVRAPDNTGVQGDNTNTGTELLTGVTDTLAGYTTNAGELVVQTPRAAFTLVYAAAADLNNNTATPASKVGWYLMEV
jgi:hypothetical protein